MLLTMHRLFSKTSLFTALLIGLCGSFFYYSLPTTSLYKPASAQQLKFPILFEKNEGQTDESVKYLSRGSGYTFYFTPQEVIMQLQKKSKDHESVSTHLKMNFLGSQLNSKIDGKEEQVTKSNYFIGNDPEKWKTSISNFSKISYENIYPGIDVVFYGNAQQLEYDIIVAPGYDSEQVQLHIDGAKNLLIDSHGDLRIATENAQEVIMQKPMIYQMVTGQKTLINGEYVLLASNDIGFKIGDHDKNLSLVIDPVLSYSTYLGGSDSDTGADIAIDDSGHAYITGDTLSLNFPTQNPYQSTLRGSQDAFISKLNSTGDALIYSTYLGGTSSDAGFGIAVDSSGNAYVTGITFSSNFPLVNPIQATRPGTRGIFVTKLNAAGNALVYSTYLGGIGVTGTNTGNSIAVDSAGNAYVTGSTNSANYPTVNAYQSVYAGNRDAVVTKINPAGSAYVYSTYLGGATGSDSGTKIVVGADGSAYISGFTSSTDFPLKNPAQATYGGDPNDAFVTKFDPSGDVVYSTYLGGSDNDQGSNIAIDSAGNAYVTGLTSSTNFPLKNPFQSSLQGIQDAFVTQFDPSGAVVFSTYFGGTGSDGGSGISLDSQGGIYIVGATDSLDLPIKNPIQSTIQGTQSAFITKFTPAGNALAYSTYLGGNNESLGTAISVDSVGTAYIVGFTSSTNFPTVNPFQAQNGGPEGTFDAFIAKIINSPSAPQKLKGKQRKSVFLVQTEYVNIITWKAPSSGPTPVEYRIYRNSSLTKLAAIVPANKILRFEDRNKKKGKTYYYYVVAIDSFGLASDPAVVRIRGSS